VRIPLVESDAPLTSSTLRDLWGLAALGGAEHRGQYWRGAGSPCLAGCHFPFAFMQFAPRVRPSEESNGGTVGRSSTTRPVEVIPALRAHGATARGERGDTLWLDSATSSAAAGAPRASAFRWQC